MPFDAFDQYNLLLRTEKRPNLTEVMIWHPRSGQPLRKLRFGDLESFKLYGCYDLTSRKGPKPYTHSELQT